jgi:hypothetical protein
METSIQPQLSDDAPLVLQGKEIWFDVAIENS